MKNFESEAIRNVALIGHTGEGKTSLAEAILFNAKSIDRLCKVDDGNSTMDYDAEEINRKISISLAVGYAIWKDTKINILDTPGFFDFEGEVVGALSAADGAIIVTSASGSMSVGTEIALERVKSQNIPSLLFVNGVNKENSDFYATVEDIRRKYKNVIVFQIPILEGTNMVGYAEVISGKAFDMKGAEIAVPQALLSEIQSLKEAIVETIADADDELAMKYLEGEEFTTEEIEEGVKLAVSTGVAVLAVGGTATANIGITNLMDLVLRYLPNPIEGKKYIQTVNGEQKEVSCDPKAPFAAQIFKSIVDPFVGKLLIFKVISGSIKAGDVVYNAVVEKQERIAALQVLRGKKQEGVDSVVAGDIAAVAKTAYSNIGDTLCDNNNKVLFEAIPFPTPSIYLAVSAKKKDDEEKVIGSLVKMLDEDCTIKLEKNIETKETLLCGVGETQLDIFCKKMKNKFNYEALLKEPRVAYRETITKKVEATGRHKKQSGGAGQFGQCSVRFEPGAADGQFEFVDAVVGGAIPRQFIASVEKGLREAIKEGVLAKYPMVDIKCTVFDGKSHPVDSKEIAFISAAKLAYDEACPKAGPCFLEPVMDVEISVHKDYLGAILSDVSKRRGRVLGTDTVKDKQVIKAQIPQSEMLKYATDLRSMTQGRGSFTSVLFDYEIVPPLNAQKIIEDAKKRAEEDKK